MRALFYLTCALGLSSCDILEELNQQGLSSERAPTVAISTLELEHGPSLTELGAYYCPRMANEPLLTLGCGAAFGAPPPKSRLSFEFGVSIEIHNPNDIPVPAADVLLALTLLEGRDSQAIGAICVSLCSEDNPNCDGRPGVDACTARNNDIHTMEDFIYALPGLIADIASGRAAEELRNSTILAGGNITLNLSFVLGVDQALRVFEKTAINYVQDYMAGRQATLDVPVSAIGTVYFRLPVLGRLGVDFGPYRSVWKVL